MKIIFLGALLISGSVSAHSLDHLEIEVLRELAYKQQEKLAHKDKVIETQAGIIVVLEQEMHHIKHEIRKESKYHELKKILKALGF